MTIMTGHLTRDERRRRSPAIVAAAALGLSAAGVIPAVALASSRGHASPSPAAHAITVYAFDINANNGGLITMPGTNPKVLSEGDEDIVNDQLTVTREVRGGYPIIGHDSGTCTFSRIITSHTGLANCVATAVLKGAASPRRVSSRSAHRAVRDRAISLSPAAPESTRAPVGRCA